MFWQFSVPIVRAFAAAVCLELWAMWFTKC